MKGLIYKITNNINGKAYIGQTIRNLNVRIDRHLKDSKYGSQLLIHKAIRKYGFENFKISILEKGIPQDQLNEREIYWIKKEKTYFHYNGYNMTKGGNYFNMNRKLTDLEIQAIQNLLQNNLTLTENDISKLFNVSLYCISDINIGKTWKNESLTYPLRKQECRDLKYDEFLEIIKMLESKLFSITYISNKYNLNTSTVSNINTGKYKKFKYPKNVNFPISSIKISNNKISIKEALELLYDYLNNKYSRKELSEKYKISEAYVKGIISNHNLTYSLSDLKFPLKSNKKYNLIKIKSKLNFIKKYK